MADELLELTRHLIDLKTEKKNYNKTINDSIKRAEAQIKEEVEEDRGPALFERGKIS